MVKLIQRDDFIGFILNDFLFIFFIYLFFINNCNYNVLRYLYIMSCNYFRNKLVPSLRELRRIAILEENFWYVLAVIV